MERAKYESDPFGTLQEMESMLNNKKNVDNFGDSIADKFWVPQLFAQQHSDIPDQKNFNGVANDLKYTNIDDELESNIVPDKNIVGGNDEVFNENRYKLKKEFENNYEFELSEKTYGSDNIYAKMAINKNFGGMIGNNTLTKIFFSDKNMNRIQKLLIKEIYIASDGKYMIEPQNPDDLFIIMKSVLLQYGKFTDKKIKKQINDLDDIVVKVSAPDVLSNVKQYYGYLKDINTPLQPSMRPINTNNRWRSVAPGFSTKILL